MKICPDKSQNKGVAPPGHKRGDSLGIAKGRQK